MPLIQPRLLSNSVKSSIIWSLACDLFRFHGRSMEMRLFVRRMNQYVLFTIKSERSNRFLLFNLIGDSADSITEEGKWVEFLPSHNSEFQGKYLSVALTSGIRALVPHAEEALACGPRPSKPDETTPVTLCLRVVSALMRQRALWGGNIAPIVAECGLCDESDAKPWVRPFVEAFPELMEEASAALQRNDNIAASRAANRVWSLNSAESGIVLDIDTARALDRNGHCTPLWPIFEKSGRSIWPIVALLDEQL